MVQAGTMMSVEEYERLPEEGEFDHELLDGELLVIPRVSVKHSRLALRVQHLLTAAGGREFVCFPEPGLKLGSRTVLGPDLCVFRAEDEATVSDDGWFDVPPVLVVEIVSPSNTAEEIERKTKAYREGGAEEVWILYPKTRTAHIHRQGVGSIEVRQDTIETPLFGGFRIELPAIFG